MMQEKIKELAARRRTATTEEERAEVAAEMARLQAEDPEAYCRALEHLIGEAAGRVEELTMAQRMGEMAHVVSMSYVARKYFGKTRAWLSQKMNGNVVNGKPAAFTSEERAVLKAALADISEVLGSVSASL